MQVNWAAAGFFGVQIDFPQLPQRIGLHEVSFVVHMEAVIDRMALHVGYKTCDIDDCQCKPSRIAAPAQTSAVRLPCDRCFGETLDLFQSLCDDVGNTLRAVSNWGPSGLRDGQYSADLLADRVVLDGRTGRISVCSPRKAG